MEPIRDVVNALPRPVRERLVELTRTPKPDARVLLRDPAWRTGWLAYVVAIASVGASIGFWEHLHRQARRSEPQFSQETYAMLAAALAIFFIAAVGIITRWLAGRSPFRDGQYVLRTGLLGLSGDRVTFVPFEAAPPLRVTKVLRNHSYSHHRLDFGLPFSFLVYDHKEADRLIDAAARARAEALQRVAEGNEAALADVDPFFECRSAPGWREAPEDRGGPRAPATGGARLRLLRWGGALVFGLAVAGALYAIHGDDAHQQAREERRAQ